MASYLLISPNQDHEINYYISLVSRIGSEIHSQANRVGYAMNGYVISAGGSIPELTKFCKETSDKIGKVEVFMGDTACKIPVIKPSIEKMEGKNRISKKKEKAKC